MDPSPVRPTKDSNLGILCSNELTFSKRLPPHSAKTKPNEGKSRWVVLTSSALHWFKRGENDLFGEEKGCVRVEDIHKVVALRAAFEVQTNDKELYQFTAASEEDGATWVRQINAAISAQAREKRKAPKRKNTLSGVDFRDIYAAHVDCVTIKSGVHGAYERIVVRQPQWGAKFNIPALCSDQESLRITLTHGRSVNTNQSH